MNARRSGEAETSVDPRVRRIVEAVESSLEEVVATSVARTWAQVPAYSASPDPELREDLRLHVDAVFRTVLATMAEGRPARRSDFSITATQATRRVRQGVSLADFLQAYRLNQVSLWERVVEAAGTDASSRDAALPLAAHVMQVIEVGSTVAAEAYMEAQQRQLAHSDRVRRDLLEDLLAGRVVSPGPNQAMLRTVGIEPSTELMVVSAVPAAHRLDGDHGTRDIASVGRDVFGVGNRGLAVVRRDEVVGISPVSGSGAARLITRLEQAQRDLTRQGLPLALGISTVRTGTSSVPEAYAEACVARDGLRGEPGVMALPMVSTFDYLVLRHDPTAQHLVRPELRQFVEEDLTRGGALIATFLEYVASDLNAKVAAERLHMHVNTAYHRLDRIAERTGCDLRSFPDVQEILIAVRLLRGPRP
ncbi:MAG TPA: helix-turn-helix domain-containing protein [Aldersonia sp.]